MRGELDPIGAQAAPDLAGAQQRGADPLPAGIAGDGEPPQPGRTAGLAKQAAGADHVSRRARHQVGRLLVAAVELVGERDALLLAEDRVAQRERRAHVIRARRAAHLEAVRGHPHGAAG